MFPPFCERLARAGFTAVSLNASGSGVDGSGAFAFPERFGHNTFTAELADLLATIAELGRGGFGVPRPTSIGVVGHSRGGGIAILAARCEPRVAALVTWSAISTVQRWTPEQTAEWRRTGALSMRNARTGEVLPVYTDALDDIERNGDGSLDIEAAAAAVAVPWLLVHGTADETVDFLEARVLHASAPSANTRFLAVDGAGHTYGAVHPWAGSTKALESVFDESIAWLRDHLP
jgi:pimeloyl-ACP methyl ester carboxylesterase